MIRFLAILALLVVTPAWAQSPVPKKTAGDFSPIVVAAEYKPHEPIVITCDLTAVSKNAANAVSWRYDVDSSQVLTVGGKLYVWAAPGEHWIEATIVTQAYREILVLIVDPANPTDFAKAKTEKIKVPEGLPTIERWEKKYLVKGAQPVPPGPAPGPGPVPPPGPGPAPDGLPSTVRSLMKATPAYSKDKALKIADVYEAVAAQAVATQGMDLNAFTTKTKEGLNNSIGVEEVAGWSQSFFRPLSEVQAKLANDRGIKSRDSAQLAALWRETADAIKAAAY